MLHPQGIIYTVSKNDTNSKFGAMCLLCVCVCVCVCMSTFVCEYRTQHLASSTRSIDAGTLNIVYSNSPGDDLTAIIISLYISYEWAKTLLVVVEVTIVIMFVVSELYQLSNCVNTIILYAIMYVFTSSVVFYYQELMSLCYN